MSDDAVERTKADPNRSRREDELVAEIERLRANPMSNSDPLARLFAELWAAFLLGSDIDGATLQDLIERTGLVAWHDATAADVEASHMEIEVGDPILRLTEEGRAIYWRGQPPASEAPP